MSQLEFPQLTEKFNSLINSDENVNTNAHAEAKAGLKYAGPN